MENLNIDIKKFSEYIVNLIYDVSTFDINNTEEQKVSPLKLQNLLYCAYAWALAAWDKKLWINNFEKWTIGPIIPEIYHDYSKNGVQLYDRIKKFVKFSEITNLERLNLELLIIDLIEKYTDTELAKLVCDNIWKNTDISSIMKDEDIAKYYSKNDDTFLDKIMYNQALENNVKFS